MFTALIEMGVLLQERVAHLNQDILKHSAPRQFITFFHDVTLSIAAIRSNSFNGSRAVFG